MSAHVAGLPSRELFGVWAIEDLNVRDAALLGQIVTVVLLHGGTISATANDGDDVAIDVVLGPPIAGQPPERAFGSAGPTWRFALLGVARELGLRPFEDLEDADWLASLEGRVAIPPAPA